MPRLSTRRLLLAILVVVLLGFFLPPLINVNRFRGRIVSSMEQALGRQVTVDSINLRLLPQPGFDLHHLVIGDDPAFGAEAMLRADEVTATFRIASLWRGRLELASLSLKSGASINPPSLNLVRAGGRWNIEALLQRASQTPSAPTAQTRAGARPRFPYIEADGGRINLKIGPEKTVYVLNEADFGLWLAAENEWAFRLAARPARTDFNLSDTGAIKIDGRFRRAANLRDTPLDLNVTVQNAQLGALTKLIYGRDRGWRGAVEGNAHLTGTPAALNVTTQAIIHDFRRYDISAINRLKLQVQCTAQYSTASEQLSAIDCRMPLGSGFARLDGNIDGLIRSGVSGRGWEPRAYDLNLSATDVGIQTLVTLASHAKKDLPDDLRAQGDLELAFNVHREAGKQTEVWSGGGHTSGIALKSNVLTPGLAVGPLKFTLEGPGLRGRRPQDCRRNQGPQRARSWHAGAGDGGTTREGRHDRPCGEPPSLRLLIAPFRFSAGAATPLNASVWFTRHQYELHLEGDAQIPRLLQAGRALGLRVPQYAAEGTARIDLRVAGAWSGFTAPQITGQAQLREVSAPVHGLNAPLQITSADLQLDRQWTLLQNLKLRFANHNEPQLAAGPLQLAGFVRMPRNCALVEQCPLVFDLQADQISLDQLNWLVNPKLAKRPWYDVFSGNPGISVLERIHARGRISAGWLQLRSLAAQHASAEVLLNAGVLALTNVRANMLGGKYRGEWHADFTGAQPKYVGTGTVDRAAMPQLAALMHDNWAAGAMSATYRLAMSGSSASQLVSSAIGTASFDWRNGVLHHLALTRQSRPLQFKSFTGQVELRERVLTLAQGKMESADGAYEISGTASLGRQLDLKLRNGVRAYAVSGPLERPRIISGARETQAAISPSPQKAGALETPLP